MPKLHQCFIRECPLLSDQRIWFMYGRGDMDEGVEGDSGVESTEGFVAGEEGDEDDGEESEEVEKEEDGSDEEDGDDEHDSDDDEAEEEEEEEGQEEGESEDGADGGMRRATSEEGDESEEGVEEEDEAETAESDNMWKQLGDVALSISTPRQQSPWPTQQSTPTSFPTGLSPFKQRSNSGQPGGQRIWRCDTWSSRIASTQTPKAEGEVAEEAVEEVTEAAAEEDFGDANATGEAGAGDADDIDDDWSEEDP
ncbi:unnamed protein product [Closterium sp. Yama58-4]|nr:unnamed protein product [Closterium sp. Yama58-4]